MVTLNLRGDACARVHLPVHAVRRIIIVAVSVQGPDASNTQKDIAQSLPTNEVYYSSPITNAR